MIALAFALLVAHALCDFALQTGDMAYGKNRHNPPKNVPKGQRVAVIWPYWLSSHALIHGGAVGLLTHSVWLGVAETVLHWGIDYAKCENWTSLHQDQALHVACKVLWVVLV